MSLKMRPLVAANWKLNKTPQESRDYLKLWNSEWKGRGAQIVFFPPATSLDAVGTVCKESQFESKAAAWEWGSQNCYLESSGAFTGEVSPSIVKELGASWALLGHSERRTIFGETDDLIAKKMAAVVVRGLRPMLCIGESLQERESGKTNSVLEHQLVRGLSQLKTATMAAAGSAGPSWAIAYEPVWAIGTGRVAEPRQVQEAHQFISQKVESLGFGSAVPILYGGSVKADNAPELARLDSVNGFLVGGASLEVAAFAKIAGAFE